MDGGRLILSGDADKKTTDPSGSGIMKFTLHNHQADGDAIVEVGGDLIFGQDLDLVLDLAPGFSAPVGSEFTLVSFSGTGDEFGNYSAGLIADPALNGWEFNLDYGAASDSAITLTVTQIPEPGVTGFILLGLGAMALRRRRGIG